MEGYLKCIVLVLYWGPVEGSVDVLCPEPILVAHRQITGVVAREYEAKRDRVKPKLIEWGFIGKFIIEIRGVWDLKRVHEAKEYT